MIFDDSHLLAIIITIIINEKQTYPDYNRLHYSTIGL
jgi:hypothetical protein